MDTHLNPAYAGAVPPATTVAVPSYRLFDPNSVFIAAIIGSPMAGVALMTLNYRRLGDRSKGTAAFLIGVAVTVLACVLGYFLPSSGSLAVGIAIAAGTKAAAQHWQGMALAQHQARGGQLSSKWAATGVGLAFLGILVVIIFAGALVLGGQHRVVVGTKDEVYFTGAATKDDAQALGEGLKKAGYFLDRGFTVILSKDSDGTAISFVVKDGIWDDAAMANGYKELGRGLASDVGGLPIKVRLVNSLKVTKKEFLVTE
jgi:hypothetical protein